MHSPRHPRPSSGPEPFLPTTAGAGTVLPRPLSAAAAPGRARFPGPVAARGAIKSSLPAGSRSAEARPLSAAGGGRSGHVRNRRRRVEAKPSPVGLRRLAAGLLLPAALLLLPPAAPARVVDRVAATVNAEVIMQSELEEAAEIYTRQMDKMQERGFSEAEKTALRRRVLEELIDRKLMEGHARELGIAASEEEINRAIEDVLVRAKINQEQLLNALAHDGMRYEEYRGQIRDQIVKAKMIHREISARVNIKDTEIEGYYLDHAEEFRSAKGVVLSHILLPLPANPAAAQVAAGREEAERIRREILDGLKFAEAATRYSRDASAAQSGRLGFFREGDLGPEMEQAVARLAEGELSPPVQSPLGIHLILLEERTTGDLRPLEKVQEQIREKLYEEAAERQFEEWRKELRRKAHVEVFQ